MKAHETKMFLMKLGGKTNPLIGVNAVKMKGQWQGRVHARKAPDQPWVLIKRTTNKKKLKQALALAQSVAEDLIVRMHRAIAQTHMQMNQKNGSGQSAKSLMKTIQQISEEDKGDLRKPTL